MEDLLLTQEEINEIFKDIFKNEISNKRLTNDMAMELLKKGLNTILVSKLFNNEVEYGELQQLEKIAVATSCYRVLGIKEICPKNIFSNKFLLDYNDTQREESVDNVVRFNKFKKVDEFNYTGTWTYEEIYNYMTKGLLNYNFKTQREGTYVTLGSSDNVIRVVTLNEKNVEEIKKEMINGTYESDTIIINCRIIRGKELKLKEVEINDYMSDISIIPHLENDSQQTILDILDGFHRITAVIRALREYKNSTGQILNGHLDVKLVLRTENEAKRLTGQTFKRSDTGKDWKAILNNDEYIQFANDLCNKVNILKGNVADTREECLALEKLTYKTLIANTIKKMKIDIKSKVKYKITLNDMTRVLNSMFEELKEDGEGLKKLKDETILLKPNMFAGYIIIANELIDKDSSDIQSFVEEIYLRSSENSLLEISEGKANINNIKKVFKEIYNNSVKE